MYGVVIVLITVKYTSADSSTEALLPHICMVRGVPLVQSDKTKNQRPSRVNNLSVSFVLMVWTDTGRKTVKTNKPLRRTFFFVDDRFVLTALRCIWYYIKIVYHRLIWRVFRTDHVLKKDTKTNTAEHVFSAAASFSLFSPQSNTIIVELKTF
jgi:hypothetical protein